MVLTQGPSSLYRGMLFNFASSIPVSALYFASYNSSLHHLECNPSAKRYVPASLLPAIAGGVAEICVQVFWVPQDVIVQRLQIRGGQVKGGMADVMKEIYGEGGFRNFYRGVGASLLTCVPGGMLSWFVYEHTKKAPILQPFVRAGAPVDMVDCIAGAFAGGVTSIAINPLDVCKTRIQTNVGAYGLSSTWAVLKNIVAHEGLRALHKGLFGRLFVAVPASIVSSISYECTMHFARVRHD